MAMGTAHMHSISSTVRIVHGYLTSYQARETSYISLETNQHASMPKSLFSQIINSIYNAPLRQGVLNYISFTVLYNAQHDTTPTYHTFTPDKTTIEIEI